MKDFLFFSAIAFKKSSPVTLLEISLGITSEKVLYPFLLNQGPGSQVVVPFIFHDEVPPF